MHDGTSGQLHCGRWSDGDDVIAADDNRHVVLFDASPGPGPLLGTVEIRKMARRDGQAMH